MRVLAFLLLVLLSLPAAQAQTIAITNARLMDASRDEQGVTIVVQDGKVATITKGGSAPAGARIIDAAGRPVTPSLAAAATQVGLVGTGDASREDDRSVSEGPTGASLDIALALDPNALTIQEARAQGLAWAMVFPSPGSGVFAGSGAVVHLDPGAGLLRKSGAAMFASAAGSQANGSRAAAWTLIRNALDEASRPAGNANTPRDDLLNPTDLEALRPVVAGRMPLSITANREADIRQAIALSRDYRIRVVVMGGAEAWRVAELLAEAKVAVILDPLDELPFTSDSIGARRENAAILARAGVDIAFMVSAQGVYLSYNVGPALREGAGIAAANGLSRGEALLAITTAPALVWTGTAAPGLAPGAPADLVIWDGDPLEPSSAPAHVFVSGREISLQTRQTQLRDRYHPSHNDDALPPGYR